MKWLGCMGILKEGISAYSWPVMLITKKLTKDKRVVTDFRHLNVRIAKNTLAYPLVRDMFSVLGSSKCKVLSVLESKRCIPLTQDYQNIWKDIVEYFHISVVAHPIYTKECPWNWIFPLPFGNLILMPF